MFQTMARGHSRSGYSERPWQFRSWRQGKRPWQETMARDHGDREVVYIDHVIPEAIVSSVDSSHSEQLHTFVVPPSQLILQNYSISLSLYIAQYNIPDITRLIPHHSTCTMASTRATAANTARKASSKASKASKVAKSKTTKATASRNTPRVPRALVAIAPVIAPESGCRNHASATAPPASIDSEPEQVTTSDDDKVAPHHMNSHDRDKLAYFRSRAHKHRVHKARARKAKAHKEHHRHYISNSLSSSSSSSLSDSETLVRRPKVSFVDNAGKKPFLSLFEEFRAVNIKYFKQIYQGIFAPRHLTKLGSSYTDGMANLDKKDKKNEDIQEASGLC